MEANPMSGTSLPTQLLRALGATVGWFALLVQFLVTLQRCLNQGLGVLDALGIYFSFFTIITNIIVASAHTSLLLAPATRTGQFFARPRVQTGIAINIILVTLVYEVMLRHLWDPTGWQLLADTLLHDVVPALYFIYWFAGVPHGQLRWRDLPRWLIYPGIYIVLVMLRGAATGVYPYGFLDGSSSGYLVTAVVIIAMAAALCIIGGLAIMVDHGLAGEKKTG
jgi:hypothetical protein